MQVDSAPPFVGDWHTLKISDMPLQSLLERLPAGVYTCDATGLITAYNQHAAQLWGRTPQLNDPVDRYCGSFKLYDAEDGHQLKHSECWMAKALETGQEFNGQEIIVERPDGERKTVLAHANPIRDPSGKLVGAVNVLVDITDRKQAQEQESRLAAIVESSDDAIVSKTLEGRILTWNRGAERVFGYTAEEAIGQLVLMVIPPERHAEEYMILDRLRRGERIEHYETERVRKDGERIAVSLTISPIRDSRGRVIGASKVARDITIRKDAQQALIQLKDELAAQLIDLQRLHEMSLRLSTTRDLQPVLDEALSTAAAIQGTDMGLLSLYDEDSGTLTLGASLGFPDDFLQEVHRVPLAGEAWSAAARERRRLIVEDVEHDSAFASVRAAARRAGFRAVHSTPLISRDERVIGILSTFFRQVRRPTEREIRLIDLCARQAVASIENAQLYSALVQADRRKDEFLATLAHELRNPLAPLSNALQVLQLSDDLSPAAERMREIMERQVNHMARLVDDLLEVSRITRGKIDLRKEPVELVSVISSAVETSRPLIDAARHQLAITLSPDPMTLEADPVRLAQVISNLLNNAAKYTEEGGQIWLTARREDQEAVVSVRDTGLGIPPEMLPHVFDMFAQVDRNLKRAQGGLGIGLTLAKNLVQMHGGRIEASSEGPGKGSEFIVRLPLVQATPTKLSTSIQPRRFAAPLPSRRVLVVDDTRAAVYMLAKLLETMGQDVRTASSARRALEIIHSEQPDVVISDIGMPEIDGYELARRLRAEPELDRTILVALTGYGQDSDRERARTAGFDYHLVKPVSLEDLQNLLHSLPQTREEVLSS